MIKYFAILAMVIDHLAWLLMPANTNFGQFLHFLGRFTAPTMAYFIVQGALRTRQPDQYVIRMAFFAIISQLPFIVYSNLIRQADWFNISGLQLNVLFNLLSALLMLLVINSRNYDVLTKSIAVLVLAVLSFHCDWGLFIPAWALTLWFCRHSRVAIFTGYTLTTIALILLNQYGLLKVVQPLPAGWSTLGLLMPPLIWALADRPAGRPSSWQKYFFYWFYPVHLLLIVLIYQIATGSIS